MENRSGHCSEKADSLKPIQRASDDGNVLFHYVGVDLGGFHVGMAHQFLNDPNIHSVFKQMGGPVLKKGGINCTMPKGMATDGFCNSRLSHGRLHCFLESGFKYVMSPGCT